MHKRHRRTHKKLNRRRRTQRGGMSFSEVSDWFQSKNPFKASDTPTLSLTERMKQGWSSFKFPWSSESKPSPTPVASEPLASVSNPSSFASRSVRIPLAKLRAKQQERLNPIADATSSPAVASYSASAVAPTKSAAVAPSRQAVVRTLNAPIKELLVNATRGNLEKSSIEYANNLNILLKVGNLIGEELAKNKLPVTEKGFTVTLPVLDLDGANRVIRENGSYLNVEYSTLLYDLLSSSKKMGGRSNRYRKGYKRRTRR